MSFIWKIVGVLLLLWVGWDLYAGYTLVWDVVYRDEDPVTYWIALGVWFALGVSCFFSWESKE